MLQVATDRIDSFKCLHFPVSDLKLKDGIEKVFNIGNASRHVVAKQQDKAVHVVITSDSNTLGGMVALINSIVSNTDAVVFFHLITDAKTSKHLK